MLCFGYISTAYSKLSNYKVHKHLLGGSLKWQILISRSGAPRAWTFLSIPWVILVGTAELVSSEVLVPRGLFSQAHFPSALGLHPH